PLSISTDGLPKKPWPKPSEIAAGHHHHKGSGCLGDSKDGLPNIPGFPRLSPVPPFQPVVLLQSPEMENCFTKDVSKTAEKCFSHIFSRWADKDFAMDKECCEIVVKMDKKCNSHISVLFKSRFVAPLLRYSCHIKHTKN
ncbi:unnamed protein product, partial [Thlaspi arvense]